MTHPRLLKRFTFLCLMNFLFLECNAKAAEQTVDMQCIANGDSLIFVSNGLWVPHSRLLRFRPLETYGKPGGQRSICTVKVDPPGYRWLSCYKQGSGPYMASRSDDSRYLLSSVVQAIKDPYEGGGRAWVGSCKVRR